ncbi:helix-turn-helix domain-containing protein [Clavibacter zhangzhiyongii]|uniref:Helix-turn-helix domain-containing protein n=1 Tax=Clavibacter zhangzhiyongii TaxID=2768071 RepID=A0A7L7Z346_9MICO|nr:helix-turn-helix domain-containing protein [Clavibacter zhangzhiyongii]QOD44148.1 helix-turn-helix domain-containing protein [Clavibacter zhangzhiyongii]
MLASWPEDLGNVARQRRQDLGLSQEELAHRSGVTRQWLTRFETAKGDAALSKVMRVLRELDLRLEVEAKAPWVAGANGRRAHRSSADGEEALAALMARVGQEPASHLVASGSRAAEEFLRRNHDVRSMVEKIGKAGEAPASKDIASAPGSKQPRP